MSDGWDSETRKCFRMMAQEQEEARRFHYALAAEMAKHPERSVSDNIYAVESRLSRKVK